MHAMDATEASTRGASSPWVGPVRVDREKIVA